MEIIKIKILLFLLVGKLYAVRFNDERCMTNCDALGGTYCWAGWGEDNVIQCSPENDKIEEVIYPSSKVGIMCTSKCGRFGYGYQWCFTGSAGAWEYCSDVTGLTYKGHECGPLRVSGDYYRCRNGEYGSLPPYNLTALKIAGKDIQKVTCLKCEYAVCNMRKKRQSEDYILGLGILSLAALYRQFYHEYQVIDQGPVRTYITMPAPPMPGFGNIELPLFVHAVIDANTLRNRTAIPRAVTQQMRDMNWVRDQPGLPNDEQGHLIAASLGGPNDVWNFAPQTPGANRRAGATSHWYTFEGEIRNFIRNTTGRHVEYNVLVAYGDVVHTRRPTRFGVNVVFRNPDGSIHHSSGDCIFTNNPNGPGPDDVHDLGFIRDN